MKTKHVFRFLVLVVLVITTQKITAQDPPGVGIGTNNPTGALLHVANPPAANMPSLRLDSIPNISLSNLQYFLAVDTGGKIVGKISADRDTMRKILGLDEKTPDIIPWNRNTYFGSGGGYPLTNYYRDNDSVIIGIQRPNNAILCVFIKNRNPKFRDITSDFGGASYNDIWIGSAVVTNGYLYLLGANNSGIRKLNRYDLNNLSASPTAITFSGSKVLTNSIGEISMTYDGSYFYFSHDCGNNMTNDNIITKHSLSGSNLSYISTITLVGAVGNVHGLLVHPIKGYVVKKQYNPIKNFNFDGTSRGYSNSFAGNFFMNDRGIFYTGMTVESFYELFYIE